MDTNILNFIWEPKLPLPELWNNACCDPSFVDANKIQTPSAPSKPTTPGAAIAARRLLAQYDFSMADESARLRTYAISRLLDLAESEKESVALGAIEKIGKIAEVGLFETKISIDIGNKTTDELEKDLQGLMNKYMSSLNVINA